MNLFVFFIIIATCLQSFCKPIQVLSIQEFQQLIENTDEKFVHVDEIKDLLNDAYFLVTENDVSTYAVARYADVASSLQKSYLDDAKYENYIHTLETGDHDVLLESVDDVDELNNIVTRKKFKNKTFCSVLVKEKLTANNLTVCNNAKFDNVTINGTFIACGANLCALISTFSSFIFSGTSADIPLTLVLRDSTGSFAATNVTVTGAIQFQSNNGNSVTLAAAPNSASYNLKLPTAQGGALQVLGNDGAGNLEWVTTVTSSVELGLLETATSADIPLTLVLRDATGSFAATNITVTGALQFQSNNGNSVTLAAAPNSTSYNLKLPTAQAGALQVLGNDGAGNLEWITTLTNSMQLNLLYTATSADIPNTLVLRDTTGSFAATNITVTGCIILTDQLSNIAATICANTNALMVSPVAPRALQTTVNGNVRGLSAVDLQMNRALATQVASGNYSVITGGQNNTASASDSVVSGGLNNNISNTFSGIVSGSGNTVGSNYAFIGGGQANTIANGADYAVIAGGFNNLVTSTGAGILGGFSNSIADSFSSYSSIIAGNNNTITTGIASIITGGLFNTISSPYSGILSGSNNSVSGSFSTIGGGQNCQVMGTFSAIEAGYYNSIGAQGFCSGIFSGSGNQVNNSFNVVLSGQNNTITGTMCTIGCGASNTIGASAGNAGIFVGTSNSIPFGPVTNSVIAGGATNTLQYSINSVICGGASNKISGVSSLITNSANFIGAGQNNTISGVGSFSGIVSGSGNTISSSYSIIGGGQNNLVTGYYSMVLGGGNNQANGDNAFASGTNAIATHTGSFVWADNNSGIFTSSVVNSFNARASGGFFFASNAAGTAGVKVTAGGNAWSSLCDQQYKINAQSVDTIATLTTLAALPINTWNLVTQNPSIIHIGPYAGDFFNAFGYGEDPTYINSMDAVGVLFASVQGLYQLYQTKNNPEDSYPEDIFTKKIALEQERQIMELEKRIKRLEIDFKILEPTLTAL